MSQNDNYCMILGSQQEMLGSGITLVLAMQLAGFLNLTM